MSNQQPIPPVTFPEGQFEQILAKHQKYLEDLKKAWCVLWEVEDEL